MMPKTSRKSQVTIFVIIGIIIVAVLGAVYFFVIRPYFLNPEITDPKAYIEKCAGDALKEAEKIVLDSNGYPSGIENNFILYSKEKAGEKVPYLCTTSTFYTSCINQDPMLLEKIRKYLDEYSTAKVEKCFSNLEENFVSGGSKITAGEMTLSIEYLTKAILVKISRKIVISKNGESRSFENFEGRIESPLYGLISTSMKITNYESDFCAFDTVSWMRFNPDVKIEKFSASDQTKIYTLTEKKTDKKIKFAVKTCVLPAGI